MQARPDKFKLIWVVVTEVRDRNADFSEVVHRDVGVPVAVDGVVVEILEIDGGIVFLEQRQRLVTLFDFKVRVPHDVAEAMPLLTVFVHPCAISFKSIVVWHHEVHIAVVVAKP